MSSASGSSDLRLEVTIHARVREFKLLSLEPSFLLSVTLLSPNSSTRNLQYVVPNVLLKRLSQAHPGVPTETTHYFRNVLTRTKGNYVHINFSFSLQAICLLTPTSKLFLLWITNSWANPLPTFIILTWVLALSIYCIYFYGALPRFAEAFAKSLTKAAQWSV